MDPADAMKSLGGMWEEGAKAFLTAQQAMLSEVGAQMARVVGEDAAPEGERRPPEATPPEATPAESAEAAYRRTLARAAELSAAIVGRVGTTPPDEAPSEPEVVAAVAALRREVRRLAASHQPIARSHG